MKNSKYLEIPNVVQVIGGIYKNPKLLERDDKYHFIEDDFCDEFHRIIFGTMLNLWQLGAKEFTLSSIEDYLKQRPKAYGVYQSGKGAEFLLKAGEAANLDTFNYYYNRMKKMTLLRAYENMGMNLDWLYDPNNILDNKKKQEQEDWLDAATLLDIHTRINDKIDAIKCDYIYNLDEGNQIADGLEELLEEYKQTPALGYPLYGDFINTVTRGARLGKFFLRSAATGVGKAIPNDTIIPTPKGFRRVDEIKVGDYLFDAEGCPTKVLAVYPQKEKKKVWVVTFSDGRKAKCCGEHLWEYYVGDEKRITDTKTMRECYQYYDIKMRTNKAVQYEKEEYLFSPYSIGMFFGKRNNELPDSCYRGSIKQRQKLVDGIIEGGGDIHKYPQLCWSLGIQPEYIYVEDIIPTEEEAEMTCFTVDNEDQLFLMNDYLVTHNTRSMIADITYIGCSEIYNPATDIWESCGEPQSCLFIATEQDLQECQSMCVAFIAAVDEEHILTGSYDEGEWERVQKAILILKKSKIFFECLPDFSLEDIENTIKKHIRENKVQYIAMDYIHSSAKILSEIGGRSGIKNLREDNVLFLLSSKLKDICVQLGVFILSATQLNGHYSESETPDQNLLRGSKAIADRIDFGSILMDVAQQDQEALQEYVDSNGLVMPNVKLSIYKNRQGRWKGIYLWINADKSTCRYNPIFCTDWYYHPIEMKNTIINIISNRESAF